MLYNSHNNIIDPCENVPYPLLGFYKQAIIPVIIEQLSAWLRQVMRSVLLNANLWNVESIKAPLGGNANKQELVLVVYYCRLDSVLTKHYSEPVMKFGNNLAYNYRGPQLSHCVCGETLTW